VTPLDRNSRAGKKGWKGQREGRKGKEEGEGRFRGREWKKRRMGITHPLFFA